MYVSENDIDEIMEKVGFAKKYNITQSDMKLIVSYMRIYHQTGSLYQELGCRFIEIVKINFTPNFCILQVDAFKKFINDNCKGNMHAFSLYMNNDPMKSKFSQYLETLLEMKIEDILLQFDKLNMYHSFKRTYCDSSVIKQIFDYHLIANLAQNFYCVEFNIKNNAVSVYQNPAYNDMFTHNYNALIKKIPLAEEIEIKIGSFRNDNRVTDEERDKISTLIKNYNILYIYIYKFLTTDIDHVKKLCQEIPELDIIIGEYYSGQNSLPIDVIHAKLRNSVFTFIKQLVPPASP